MIKEEQEKLNAELFDACKYGELEKVKELIEKGAEVDARDVESRTPLHLASRHGHLEVVKYLIANGANYEAYANYYVPPLNIKTKMTPLHMAIMGHKIDVTKYLIENVKVNKEAKTDKGDTSLHLAVQTNSLATVIYLIEQGVQKEVENNDNFTPLGKAILNNKPKIVNYLFLNCDAFMPIYGTWYYTHLFKDKQKKATDAQSVFDYVLRNKDKYKREDIQAFKNNFIGLEMSEEDARNLKTIVKFL